MTRTLGTSLFVVLSISLIVPFPVCDAETLDFGGHPERFKGGGDRTPPECQLDIPRAASGPFFIKWNCVDEYTNPQDIRTQLWIYRNGEAASALNSDFLGFPAAAYIDENVLRVSEFSDGLPVGFRLYAWDRAGIATVSPLKSVLRQASGLGTCTVQLATEATESTGDTTGVPSSSVALSNIDVVSQELGENKLRVFNASGSTASPCEISSVCEDDEQVSFDATITIADDDTFTGTIAISPGSVSSTLTGTTATKDDTFVTSVQGSGTTTIDGTETGVTLNCSE